MNINLNKGSLTPQDIFNNLYTFPVKIQYCHHNTTSYAAHKALDKAYEALNDLKDEIIEQLIGYGVPRFTKIDVGSVTGSPDSLAPKFANDIIAFAKQLEIYASSKYPNIENLAQEYSGVGAQLAYLLTLK